MNEDIAIAFTAGVTVFALIFCIGILLEYLRSRPKKKSDAAPLHSQDDARPVFYKDKYSIYSNLNHTTRFNR